MYIFGISCTRVVTCKASFNIDTLVYIIQCTYICMLTRNLFTKNNYVYIYIYIYINAYICVCVCECVCVCIEGHVGGHRICVYTHMCVYLYIEEEVLLRILLILTS